ncbi:hypothetical protein EAF04_008989 [Stromatinia cepivora]|nr:hypothetical protein EAF04_008989 [Stromatinia cepivora]
MLIISLAQLPKELAPIEFCHSADACFRFSRVQLPRSPRQGGHSIMLDLLHRSSNHSPLQHHLHPPAECRSLRYVFLPITGSSVLCLQRKTR